MFLAPIRQVYRIDTNGFSCRSVAALASINVRDVDGVQEVTVGRDGTLLAVTSADRDLYDDIVRAAVTSGLDPFSARVVDLKRGFDPNPLSLAEAEALGLIEPPREPVRAVMETIQRLRVSVTDGYDPDMIIVSAGIPSEIEFSEAHGCLGTVVFDGLGIEQSLEEGGAVVKLPPLEPGTYSFRCGMDIVHGSLVAE